MKRALFILFLLVITVISSVLTRLNKESVNFNYYFGSIDISLVLLLFMALCIGALIGLLLTASSALSSNAERRRLRRALQLREQEIRNLRDIPIKGRH